METRSRSYWRGGEERHARIRMPDSRIFSILGTVWGKGALSLFEDWLHRSCEESVRTVCLILLVGCGRPPTMLLALIASLAVQSITSLCCFFVFVRSFCSGSRWRSTGSWRGPWSLFTGRLLSTCTLISRSSRWRCSTYAAGSAVFISRKIKFWFEIVGHFLFFFLFLLGFLCLFKRCFRIFCVLLDVLVVHFVIFHVHHLD